MLFNSISFVIFLPIVFLLYWFLVHKYLKLQNFLIVVASYIFYGWWDWRFLFLILFSTIVDYSIGLGLSKQCTPAKRKALLWISIFINLGLLGVFKYYNFFLDNFIAVFSSVGIELKSRSLNIILPVGISFYTFQTLSYTIDVYRKKLKPTEDFIVFAAFVSFFPQLVAGPIERASHLLPQFHRKRLFDYERASDGMRQILWGFFKKVVVADNCAELANQIFNHSHQANGSTLLLGAICFTFQIYGDFSGYSDIAIGMAKLFGFDLKQNFAFPYFSRDIAEFWRRWHISLSSWFRDYLYIPLGGSKGGTGVKIRNTFIIFIVSGFWHGANWTFIVWGGLNALYFLPLLLRNKNRRHLEIVAQGKFLPSLKELFQIFSTFGLTVIAWVFFRAKNMVHAINYLMAMFSISLFEPLKLVPVTKIWSVLILVSLLMLVEWLGREKAHALAFLGGNHKNPLRYLLYYIIVISIFWFGGKEQQFIYFQF